MKKILLIALFSVFGFGNENIHTTFSCEFKHYADKKGSIFTKDSLVFKIITNNNDGTFVMKGNNGSSEGTTIRGNRGLSFIEVTELGNITTTTMVMVEPYGGKQEAAHSRNMLINGKLLASQYYGTCQLVRGSQTKKVKLNISTEMKFQVYKELKIEKRLKGLSLNDKKYILEALEGTMPSREEMKKYMSAKGMLLCGEIPEIVLGNYDKKSRDEFDSLYDSIDGIMEMLDKKPVSRYDKIIGIVGKKIDIDSRMKKLTPYDKKIMKKILNGTRASKKELDQVSSEGLALLKEVAEIIIPEEER